MKRLYKTQFRRRILISTLLTLMFCVLISTWFFYHYKKQAIVEHYTTQTLYELPGLVNETLSSGLFPPFSKWEEIFSKNSRSSSITLCNKNNHVMWSSIQLENKPGQPSYNIQEICNDLNFPFNSIKLVENFNNSAYIAQTIPWGATKYNPQGRIIFTMKMDSHAAELQQLRITTGLILVLTLTCASLLLFFFYTVSFSPLQRLEKELSAIKKSKQNKLLEPYPEDLKNVTEALNELLFQQKESEERYKRSLNDLAHSLKTRVAVSQTLLSALGDGKTSEINQQLMAMDDVIQGQLKRASFGVKGIAENKTLLRPVFDDLIAMFNKIHFDKKLHVEESLSNKQTISMAKNDLMEVLGNVLENTYRFAFKTISIDVNQEEKGLLIEITNDGPPIDNNAMETLFQRGVRADQRHAGTGLGLALCDEIIRSYKGKIWFDSPSNPRMNVCLKIQVPN